MYPIHLPGQTERIMRPPDTGQRKMEGGRHRLRLSRPNRKRIGRWSAGEAQAPTLLGSRVPEGIRGARRSGLQRETVAQSPEAPPRRSIREDGNRERVFGLPPKPKRRSVG